MKSLDILSAFLQSDPPMPCTLTNVLDVVAKDAASNPSKFYADRYINDLFCKADIRCVPEHHEIEALHHYYKPVVQMYFYEVMRKKRHPYHSLSLLRALAESIAKTDVSEFHGHYVIMTIEAAIFSVLAPKFQKYLLSRDALEIQSIAEMLWRSKQKIEGGKYFYRLKMDIDLYASVYNLDSKNLRKLFGNKEMSTQSENGIESVFNSAINAALPITVPYNQQNLPDLDLTECVTLDQQAIEERYQDQGLIDEQEEPREVDKMDTGNFRNELELPLDAWLKKVERLARILNP